jgi:hypothetical protein
VIGRNVFDERIRSGGYFSPDMPYLLDTYNILHAAIPMGGALANLTVRSLCQWILASPGRISATLVMDGRAKPDEPGPNEFPDISLVYSGAGVSADKVIGQLVERSRHRKKLTVVSSDRAVVLHARQNGASAISSEAFLELLLGAQKAHRRAKKSQLPHNKTAGTATTGETDHWLKEFGITPPPPQTQIPDSLSPDDPDSLSDEDLKRLMGG